MANTISIEPKLNQRIMNYIKNSKDRIKKGGLVESLLNEALDRRDQEEKEIPTIKQLMELYKELYKEIDFLKKKASH